MESADKIRVAGDVSGANGLQAKRSTFTVRNSSGEIAFAVNEGALVTPFSGRLRKGSRSNGGSHAAQSDLHIHDAVGYGGIVLPKSLPAGKYSAVWKIDDIQSNLETFTVGSEKPPFLTLEPLKKGHGACMLLHVFISGKERMSFCKIVFDTKILIDGEPHLASLGCGGGGGGDGISPGEGFSMALTPAYSLAKMKGRHKISAAYGAHRSQELTIQCD